MKDKIIIGLLAVSIIFNIVNFIRSGYGHNPHKETAAAKDSTQQEHEENAGGKQPIEVGDVMTKLQRHINKLWFAGNNQNWPLAKFYVEEMDETMDIITNNDVQDEGIKLSPLMQIMGLKPLDEMRTVVNVQDEDKFKTQYMAMITNCNNCHVAAKHEFIVIKEPTTPAYDNQVYTKR